MVDHQQRVEIVNRRGLHARASAALAKKAGAAPCNVMVSKDGHSVTATSIMGLMMLGAAKGDHITVQTSGDNAEAVLGEICAFISARFGESE